MNPKHERHYKIVFILISCCEIYPCYVYILFTNKKHVLEAALMFFWYLFIIFIDFLAIRSLLTSYSCISVKWEYCGKAVVASSVINAQEQGAKGLGHSSIPRCLLRGLKRKQNLEPRVCSFNFLLREIRYMFIRI